MKTPEWYEEEGLEAARAGNIPHAQFCATMAIAAAICAGRDILTYRPDECLARVSRPTNAQTPVEHSSLSKY